MAQDASRRKGRESEMLSFIAPKVMELHLLRLFFEQALSNCKNYIRTGIVYV